MPRSPSQPRPSKNNAGAYQFLRNKVAAGVLVGFIFAVIELKGVI